MSTVREGSFVCLQVTADTQIMIDWPNDEAMRQFVCQRETLLIRTSNQAAAYLLVLACQ